MPHMHTVEKLAIKVELDSIATALIIKQTVRI